MHEEDSPQTRLIRWYRGERPGPYEVALFPTNRCNLRCSICWQRWAEKNYGTLDHSREVSDDRLLRLVDEGAELGVRWWKVCGGGEPLVRGDLVLGLCERIRAHGMNGMLHTNGTLFRPADIDRLVAMEWQWVHVSLDGPDADTNDRIRSAGSFERAVANLRLFAEARQRRGTGFPRTSLHPVITNLTWNRLDEMVELAHELDCAQGIGLARLIVESDGSAALELSPEQERDLPGQLARVAALAERYGLPHNVADCLPSAASDRNDSPATGPDGRLTGAACFEPFTSLFVVAEGLAGACCMFWDDQAPSVHALSLCDIWYGDWFERLRRSMLARRDLPPYCARCPRWLQHRTEAHRKHVQLYEYQEGLDGRPARRAAVLARRALDALQQDGLAATARRTAVWLRKRRPPAP